MAGPGQSMNIAPSHFLKKRPYFDTSTKWVYINKNEKFSEIFKTLQKLPWFQITFSKQK
jgi:hypothetical protein